MNQERTEEEMDAAGQFQAVCQTCNWHGDDFDRYYKAYNNGEQHRAEQGLHHEIEIIGS